MKRRNAVQNIALVTFGTIFIPSCKTSNGFLVGNEILNYDQLKIIKEVSELILPIKNLKINNPENLTEFIITMLNNCYSPNDINKYLSGLDEYNELIKAQDNTHSLISHNINTDGKSEKLIFFIDTTKELSIIHFTSSEYYLTEYLDYEYAPARYIGCVSI